MSSAQFVEMYHPLLPETVTDPVLVSLSSVDDHAARGWLLVDPDVVPPEPSTPYYTRAAADSRFAHLDDDGTTLVIAGQPVGGAGGGGGPVDAADVTGLAPVATSGSYADLTGKPTTQVHRAFTDARPAGVPAGYVQYFLPTQPTTGLDGDDWVKVV